MERDHEDKPGYQRLPRPGPAYPDDTPVARQPGTTRDGGVRRARRVSSWTAAALIAGVAATNGYFAHASQPAAPAAGATAGTAGTATTGAGTHKACPAAPVATSGGSGVTAAMPASGNCAGGSSGTVMPVWSGRDD
jgi:hypothetical protein